MSPKHSDARRRAEIILHGTAEQQVAAMDQATLARLDPHLVRLSFEPHAGIQRRPDSPVREYAKDGVRILYVATVLGTVVLVAYVEA
ncbi:hypothetical protein [Kitasatospora sp. NPDC050543]|uniref:hypothetical protein n=1 Tax=Kitasatospora sp. NPDC050543 TaxID=3364054 RepID=UPI00378B981B